MRQGEGYGGAFDEVRLPKIGYDPEKVKREVVAMGGLNWSDKLQDGDLRDALNLSFRRWPYLTTRKGRKQMGTYSGVTALTAHGKLAAVRGTDLLLDGKKVGTVKAGEKRFAVVNTKLVIWPDMVYLDLEDNRVKPMGAKVTLPKRACTFTEKTIEVRDRAVVELERSEMCSEEHPTWKEDKFTTDRLWDFPRVKRAKGVTMTAAGVMTFTGVEEIKFENLQNGDIALMNNFREINANWGDGYATASKNTFAVIRARNLYWDYVTDGYHESRAYEIYEKLPDIPSLLGSFKNGDAIAITGAGRFDKEAAVIEEVTETGIRFTAGLFEKDLMESVAGETTEEGEPLPPPKSVAVETAVTLERKVPPLEFICESQNRLWGCEGHTIWCSALGDPTNFYVNKGASTDSFSVAVGTDGAFTGCVGYSEGVLFWKEDCLHKALGSYPANYEVHTYGVPGVKAGCDRSQVIISDILYYLGERGVYAYGGGTPRLLSGGFGERRLTGGVAGSDGEKYYLSAKEGGKSHLLVYDPGKGLWLREDDTAVRDFARLGNALYFADGAGKVWLVDGGGGEPQQEWMAQFAPLYETVAGRKRYSRLLLRLELPAGSWVTAETRCDDGPWMECGTVAGKANDVIPMRIPFNRCDKLELRLKGKGPCGVLSVMREFTLGSER